MILYDTLLRKILKVLSYKEKKIFYSITIKNDVGFSRKYHTISVKEFVTEGPAQTGGPICNNCVININYIYSYYNNR